MVHLSWIDGDITSKRANVWFNLLMNSDDTQLKDLYKTCSPAKKRAYDYFRSLYCNHPYSRRFRIICHNSTTFTVAWLFDDVIEGECTGELHRFMAVKTASNLYYFLAD